MCQSHYFVFDAEDNDIVRATVLGHLELNCELEVMPTCTATPHVLTTASTRLGIEYSSCTEPLHCCIFAIANTYFEMSFDYLSCNSLGDLPFVIKFSIDVQLG